MPDPIYVPAPFGQEAVIFHNPDTCRLWDHRPERTLGYRCPVVVWAIDRQGNATPVLPADVVQTPDSWLMITLAEGRLCDVGGDAYESLADATEDWLEQAQAAWDREHAAKPAA